MIDLKEKGLEKTIESIIFQSRIDLLFSDISESLGRFNNKFGVRINVASTRSDELVAQGTKQTPACHLLHTTKTSQMVGKEQCTTFVWKNQMMKRYGKA